MLLIDIADERSDPYVPPVMRRRQQRVAKTKG
jgi:hypothetical protein